MKRKFSQSKNSQGKRAGRRLGVQSLESRGMLAGDVALAIGAGNVTLTGDASGNEITITSLGGGTYEIAGQGGTTINGGVTPLQFDSSQLIYNLTLNLKGGDDIVTIDGGTGDSLPGLLSVGGGDGDNEINIVGGLSITGKLAVVNGFGEDTVVIDDVSAGSISITNGKGGSHVTIGDVSTTADITVNALADGGAGNDIALDNVSARAVSVSYGGTSGPSTMTFDNMNVLTNLTLLNTGGTVVADLGGTANTIGGKLTVSFADGNHDIDLAQIDVAGEISIRTNAGNKTIDIATTTAGGNLSITGSAGNETINIVDAVVGGGAGKGNLTVTGGVGDTDVTITGGDVDGNVSITNGVGDATVALGTAAALNVAGAVSIRNGNGNATISVDNVTSARDIAITNGHGDNTITFGATGANDIQAGGVSIRNGNGDATINIDDTQIFRDLAITNGNSNGVNLVNIGTNAAVSSRSLSLIDGSGDSTVVIDDMAVASAFSFRGLAGADSLTLDGSFDVNGGTSIDTGADNDAVTINSGADLTVGRVSITLGQGDDDLTVVLSAFNTVTNNFLFDGGIGGFDELVSDVALTGAQLKKAKYFEDISP